MRISHSACQTYLECGFKYFMHYMRKIRPIEEKSSFLFGAAIDLGLNNLLETRDLQQSLEIFHTKWAEVKNGTKVKYTKADLEEHLIEDVTSKDVKERSWNSLDRKGHIILEEYNTQIMPRIKEVIKVQLDDTIANENGDELVIKVDFIGIWESGQRILFDNKTSSVKYEEDSVKNSEQLAAYFEPLKDEYKLDACGYIVIPKKINSRKKPAIQIEVIIDKVSEDTAQKTFGNFDHVINEVKEARFPKNHKSCISKFGKCTYYDYCNNNRSMVGLEEKKDK